MQRIFRAQATQVAFVQVAEGFSLRASHHRETLRCTLQAADLIRPRGAWLEAPRELRVRRGRTNAAVSLGRPPTV